jgi:two-component system response regulator AtoC
LRVVEIVLPPLRDRLVDVPLLSKAFLKEFATENSKPLSDFTPDAMDAMLNYPWPGNVRELRTAVEHAVVLSRTDKVTLRDLPTTVRTSNATVPTSTKLIAPSDMTVAEAEKQLIARALKECEGNRTAAAKKIGMSRRTLHRKLIEYKLQDL